MIRVHMMILRSSRPTDSTVGGGASTTQGAIPFLTDLVDVV